MPNNSRVTPANDSAVIHEISRWVYQFILEIHQQQPELLKEKYRNLAWQDSRTQGAFLEKLKEGLQDTPDSEARVLKIQKFLDFLLLPSSFQLPIFSDLEGKVRALTQPEAEASLSADIEQLQPPEASLSPTPRGIAILLIDAENLQLDIETEKFLAEVCTYPIQIKVAFANWRNMGKQDIDFHGRGYELIHVPAGKDSADVKMATVGSSIFVHYPTAREVFVCSSDRVLTHLCNTLQTHGLTVYQVCKVGENLRVVNSKTGQVQTYSLKPTLELPSLEDCLIQLKEIIKIEQERTGSAWLKLSRISNLFQHKYKLTLSQVVSTYLPGKRARDIFIENPTDFAVHQLPNQSQLYVTLFEVSKLNKTDNQEISHLSDAKKSAAMLSNIESKEDLEKALIKLLNSLTNRTPGSYILLPTLGSEFHKQYGQPITQVITHLQLGTNFLKFLQSCSAFSLEKTAKNYQVAIRVTQPEKVMV